MTASTSQHEAVFEFPARIRYSEADHRGLLTLPGVINYFQDCSTFQSEALGVGAALVELIVYGRVALLVA